MAKLLVADDEPGVRKLLTMTLEIEGYEVVSAVDGQAAFDAAAGQSFDLFVLDVMMPGIDGLELCRRFKSDAVTSAVPIVMLTAKAQETDVEDGQRAGADVYMTKPFEPGDLVDCIEALLA